MLDKFKVPYAVAIDEPNKGRPISAKVGPLMRDECSSAIFILTADERFERKDGQGELQEVWRPSENVIFELGAASVLYDRRIVIFKEKGVSFSTEFSDLGHIEFDRDQLVREMGSLFSELVAVGILEVRKGLNTEDVSNNRSEQVGSVLTVCCVSYGATMTGTCAACTSLLDTPPTSMPVSVESPRRPTIMRSDLLSSANSMMRRATS
jgi:hypothetical protein